MLMLPCEAISLIAYSHVPLPFASKPHNSSTAAIPATASLQLAVTVTGTGTCSPFVMVISLRMRCEIECMCSCSCNCRLPLPCLDVAAGGQGEEMFSPQMFSSSRLRETLVTCFYYKLLECMLNEGRGATLGLDRISAFILIYKCMTFFRFVLYSSRII